MAGRGSCCTLTRIMSFEEEPGICLQAAGGASVVAPPSSPPPPKAAEERRHSLTRWLQQLDAAGAVELPPTFGSLVAAEEADQRRACTASRGWLAPTVPAAPTDPWPTPTGGSDSAAPPPAPSAGTADPKLREALRKVQQLDGALQAAGQRAAEVAARGQELEQRMRDAGAADGNSCAAEGQGAAGVAVCGLEGAMHRERRRLQQAARLCAALEGGAAEEVLATPRNSSDMGVLTPEQERLVDMLLGQADAGDGPSSVAASAAQDANPFSAAADQLAAIDARLAQLGASIGGQEHPGWAAAPAAVPPAEPLDVPKFLGGEEDLEEFKASYLRARAEALDVAQRLRDIDAALASLRACSNMGAAC